MSSSNRSTSDIEDAFSSMNILNHTSVSSDYFPASSGSSSFNSSENSTDNRVAHGELLIGELLNSELLNGELLNGELLNGELLNEDIWYAGSDTRPPMLDRTDFESWQQRIRLYCLGKDNGENIMKSITEGPFQMGKCPFYLYSAILEYSDS
ncbi:hypothetical protein Tco_1469165 [Tanacetum coccineum]